MITMLIPLAIIGVMSIAVGFIEIMLNLIKRIIQLLWLLYHVMI